MHLALVFATLLSFYPSYRCVTGECLSSCACNKEYSLDGTCSSSAKKKKGRF